MVGAFGRDGFIEELWILLEEKSIHLLGERRVGKTTVIQEMASKPRGGVLAFFFELEAISTPNAFAQVLYDRVAECLPLGLHFQGEMKRLRESLGGSQAAGITISRADQDWQRLIDFVMQGLCQQEEYSRIVFFFDEVAMMLQEMKETDRRAMLNTLRQLRQVYGKPESKMRMVFTGSIGLHHVMTGLHEQGYTNRPTNDMTRKVLPPLCSGDAESLAELWLTSEGLWEDTPTGFAASVALVTDGLPFYIRELVRVLRSEQFPLTDEGLNQAIRFLATDASSPIEMDDYNKRIDAYYKPIRRPIARALLDTLAREEALSLPELSSRLPQYSPEDLETTLKLLEEDLYIYYNEAGGFEFRYGFIRRVWLLLQRKG